MTSMVGPARGVGVAPLLGVGAAVLAAIPLVLSRLDGDGDLDPFFAVLLVAALAIAALTTPEGLRDPRRGLVAVALVVAWLGAAAWAGFLLAWFQTACGCSSPAPTAPPATGLDAVNFATISHVAATYGGGLLVALAVFGGGPRRARKLDAGAPPA